MSVQDDELSAAGSTSVDNSTAIGSSQTAVEPRLRIPRTIVTDPDGNDIESRIIVENGFGKESEELPQRVSPDNFSNQAPTDWSETTNIPQKHLGFVQIFSLIINSIVGTGIFTQPGYVLALTKSKPIALALWAAGGLYTALTLIVFLEYGTALPFNGGPMVYLDESFPRPRLLALTIFSFHRIFLGSSASNCRTLAINLITLANPGMSTSEIQDGLVQLVSVLVIAVISLLVYFMLPFCFVLNSSFAMFKLILIAVMALSGLIVLRGNYAGVHEFNKKHTDFDAVETVTGMIYVIFSYQGFVNVNCIAGEIKEIKRNLKYAGIAAILLITILYMFIVAVFYIVLDYISLTSRDGQDNVSALFAEKVFGSTTGTTVAVSLSAFATLIFQVYTLARVKQAIAWRRIIPFYKFFGRQDPQFDSPGGGLILHAIFTAIPLLALSSVQSDERNFALGIYSWGHQVIMLFLGLGLLFLKQRMRLTIPNWDFSYMRQPLFLYGITFLFTASNVAILVMTALPSTRGDIPRWYWPVTIAVVIGAALLYWGALRILMIPFGSKGTTLGSMIGFEPHIYESDADGLPDDVRYLMWEARHEGTRRLVKYRISGPSKKLYECYKWTIQVVVKVCR